MKYILMLIGIMVFLSACTTANLVDDSLMEEEAMMEEPHEEDSEEGMMEEEVMEETGDLMMEEEGMMEEDSMMEASFSGTVLAGKETKYIDFNEADYNKALKENKKILLYFYANWCPTCKAEQPKAHAAFDTLKDEETVGFRVNYRDSDTDDFEESLAKKYGISYQHTKVILVNGERVSKSPESWSTERYVDELSKV